MSPEQARGRAVDKRCDIWAFGCVVYEMLTGRRAFDGDDVSVTLASVLKEDVEWEALPAQTPESIRRLLRRCLERELRRRLSAIGDARLEIEEVGHSALVPSPPRLVRRSPAVRLTVAISLLALAGVGGGYAVTVMRPTRHLEPAVSMTIEPPPGGRFEYGPDRRFAVSPDGTLVVFSAMDADGQSQLWLRSLDGLDARPLKGTERAASPFFSNDSRAIAFVVDRQLRRLDLAGGLPMTILNIEDPNVRGPLWTADQKIRFGRGAAIIEVPAIGGTERQLTIGEPGDDVHRFPSMLPDGRMLFLVRSSAGSHGIFLSTPEKAGRRLVVRALSSFAIADSWLLYGDRGRLLAQPFDPSNGEATGEPRELIPQVPYGSGSGTTQFAASPRAVVFLRGSGAAQIDRFSPAGALRATVIPQGDIEGRFSVSPDGLHVAYSVVDPDTGFRDVWLGDLHRKTQRRLTHGDGSHWLPVWSPSGDAVAFASQSDGRSSVKVLRIAGNGESERRLEVSGRMNPSDWARHGQLLVLDQSVQGRQTDVVLHNADTKQVRALVATPANETDGVLSPNERWLAYSSDESGWNEVYLRSVDGDKALTKLSVRGGRLPRWSHDGSEVYFVSPGGAIMAARVPENGQPAGQPRFVLTVQPQSTFAVGPDGDIFVQHVPDRLAHPNLSVIVNWQRLLDRPMP